jgi:alanine racemase
VVSIGYGDGYPQHAPEGTPVLVRGKIVSLVGQVSMDTLMIDVSGLPGANIHDEVTLWGKDLPIEYVASVMGIPPTVLLTGMSHRVSRSIVDLESDDLM